MGRSGAMHTASAPPRSIDSTVRTASRTSEPSPGPHPARTTPTRLGIGMGYRGNGRSSTELRVVVVVVVVVVVGCGQRGTPLLQKAREPRLQDGGPGPAHQIQVVLQVVQRRQAVVRE